MNNQDSEPKRTRGQNEPSSDQRPKHSGKHEIDREDADHLWDKTFTDNEDRNADGYLSRTQRRRQNEHNSMITTVLVVLIILLAAVPLAYWLNHRESYNHPAPERTERVASSHSTHHHHHHAKSVKKHKAAAKKSTKKKKVVKHQQDNQNNQANANSSSQQQASSANNNTGSRQSSSTRTVTVQQGQGIYRVAANNGMTVSELEQMNGLSAGSEIHPGQQLRVR